MRLLILSISFFISSLVHAQDQTVGVFVNDSMSYNGYTLLFPSTSRSTYLIDNCGYEINSWQSEQSPGLSAYLLEDGTLLRTGRVFTNFAAGGVGGLVEKRSWDDELIWKYQFGDNTYSQHHDIEPLPNGNFLVLSWERVTREDVIFSGRNPQTIGTGGVWYEKITEVTPIGSDSIEVIWEWRLFNHLVQDFDNSKINFGVVADHPERLDINYQAFLGEGPGNPDWIHFNSIDYNPELDQIMLSSRNFSELYIIDHSTTTIEASSSFGGAQGKGGDILYRWGNPIVYKRGTDDNKQLFGQHDTHWIPKGMPNEGKIMIFNNGENRPEGDYSTVDIIEAPVNMDGSYDIITDSAFGPSEFFYSFKGEGDTNFFSRRVSGAQQLPNGNILICDGNAYRIFEVNTKEELVWDYINPISNAGPISQGTTSFNRDLFRAHKYGEDYPAFDDKLLEPGDKLELNPFEDDCEIFSISTSTNNLLDLNDILIAPNPTDGYIYFKNLPFNDYQVQLFDISGRLLRNDFQLYHSSLDLSQLEPGLYILRLRKDNNEIVFKVIRS